MSNIDTGGPAFPQDAMPAWSDLKPSHPGMTLRDYFAAHASEADLAAQAEVLRVRQIEKHGVGVLPDSWRCTARYMHADDMLKARQA